MKQLKKISSIFVIVLLLLQSNSIKASTIENSSIEDLATKIAISKEGKDFLAYSFAYALFVNSLHTNLDESEKLIIVEKLNKLGNASYIDLNEESKKEFSKILGVKNHYNFDEFYTGYLKSKINLKKVFSELKNLNKEQIQLVIESASSKTDILKHMETMMESFGTCFGRKTAIFLGCAGIDALLARAVFSACMFTAIAGEVAATGPASIAVLAGLLGPDVTTCAVVASGFGFAGAVICVEAYVNAVFGCW